ncbi:hypothetical protein C5167_048918 [Papaver somniferum]|uniref:Uncharacterized protein n=1 Tax=Papaver somniferum TaxID=3469 RepID=A0A4Y7KMV5_PAPSO|nr:hypothetical protein C5167_048918 [Papaver somniferum]
MDSETKLNDALVDLSKDQPKLCHTKNIFNGKFLQPPGLWKEKGTLVVSERNCRHAMHMYKQICHGEGIIPVPHHL